MKTEKEIVKALADWSKKYPRDRIYGMNKRTMDDELVAIEEAAKQFVASPSSSIPEIKDEDKIKFVLDELQKVKYEPHYIGYFLQKDDFDMGGADFCENCIDEQLQIIQAEYPKSEITKSDHDPDFGGGRSEPASCGNCGEPFQTEFTSNEDNAIHLLTSLLYGHPSDATKWELEIALRHYEYANPKTQRILLLAVNEFYDLYRSELKRREGKEGKNG